MSGKKLSPAQAGMLRMLGPLDGEKIPGGCEQCNAYQTAELLGPGVWNISVHHDEWCPMIGGKGKP